MPVGGREMPVGGREMLAGDSEMPAGDSEMLAGDGELFAGDGELPVGDGEMLAGDGEMLAGVCKSPHVAGSGLFWPEAKGVHSRETRQKGLNCSNPGAVLVPSTVSTARRDDLEGLV